MNIKSFKKLLAETFFPRAVTCDICGVETFGGNLCADCLRTVIFNNGATCPLCGRRTALPELCLECKAQPPKFSRAVSALSYEGGAVILVAKFKQGNAYLKEFFADLLAEKIKALPQADLITYVPMTKKAQRKRGYNQSELLAKSLSERVNVPVVNALKKVKDTKEQKELSRKERAENLRGCFAVTNRELITDKCVLLVDDVLTTGATAEEIATLLLKCGAKNVLLATAASVENKIIKTDGLKK